MNDLHFIDYEPKVILVDTLGLRPDTELAHRRLCDMIWSQGQAPLDDDYSLADMARVPSTEWARVKAELMCKGWHIKDNRFTHSGTIKTLERCAEKYSKKVAASKVANSVRWSDRSPTGVRPDKRTASDRTPNNNHNHTKEESGARLSEVPSWVEFWAYCTSPHCGLPAEWYARDKFLAAEQDNWKGKSDWRKYALRVRGWWNNDGCPMTPKGKPQQGSTIAPPQTKHYQGGVGNP